MVTDLEKRGIITDSHSPSDSPVWLVRDRRLWFTVHYRQLNTDTMPLTAAVLTFAELITQIQRTSYLWMATVDVKNGFYDSTPGT